MSLPHTFLVLSGMMSKGPQQSTLTPYPTGTYSIKQYAIDVASESFSVFQSTSTGAGISSSRAIVTFKIEKTANGAKIWAKAESTALSGSDTGSHERYRPESGTTISFPAEDTYIACWEDTSGATVTGYRIDEQGNANPWGTLSNVGDFFEHEVAQTTGWDGSGGKGSDTDDNRYHTSIWLRSDEHTDTELGIGWSIGLRTTAGSTLG